MSINEFKFDKNRMQIAVGTKRDLFEAETFKASDVDAMRERFQQKIGQITNVLDAMLAHKRRFGDLGIKKAYE